jgi:hypothetical protein
MIMRRKPAKHSALAVKNCEADLGFAAGPEDQPARAAWLATLVIRMHQL